MRKQILFGIITVILVIVLAGSTGGVVLGKPQRTVRADTKAYLQLEEIYVEQVREMLEAEGLSSAGVTLTYERDRDGSRQYTLLVHHHRLAGFGKEELAMLEQQMEEAFFTGEDCSLRTQLVWKMEG